MRQRQARRHQADLVEIAHDAVREIPVRPFTLVHRLEQVRVAPAVGRCLRDARSSVSLHHCTPAGPCCTSKVSLAQADATASLVRSFCAGSGADETA
jgi:hypothetical protein